jgi:hypothetical protein
MVDMDGVAWVLWKIESLNEITQENAKRGINSTTWWPTHRNIWRGSYDVWCCEQDRIDSVEIPRRRMKEAEDGGYIKNETRKHNKYECVVWSLTESGKALLEQAKREWSKGND